MGVSSFSLCLLAAAFFSCRPVEAEDKFDICKQRVERIRNGTEVFQTTYKGVALTIDNKTIEKYMHWGHVSGMNEEYERTSRQSFLTLKTEGCKIVCQDPTDWYWASDFSLTLGIVSNWILPIIALLAALPYDSDPSRTQEKDGTATRASRFIRAILGRPDGTRARWLARKSFARTVWALLNWLGSPQVAMTATLFNIYQIWRCSRAATTKETPPDRLKTDAYYVLCCIGQFEFPMGPSAEVRTADGFLETMVYGLLRPICDDEAPTIPHVPTEMELRRRVANTRAKEMTASLLQSIAFQMRTLRRQGVFASFASIFLFYIAFAVSVVLAFADIGERTTAHSLAFGMLISWFPLLLLFAILDRNPTSAGRSRDLITRWMWNVRAVRKWRAGGQFDVPPEWWSQDSKDVALEVSDFVGQGRQVGYNGIALAVLDSIAAATTPSASTATTPEATATALHTANAERERLALRHLDRIAKQTVYRVQNCRPPPAWWVSALISFVIVWAEIGAASMISIRIPTVGVGCRSLSYLVYGGLSTLPMLMQLALNWWSGTGKRLALRVWVRRLSDTLCMLAVGTLVFITFAAFSGVLKNCTCRGGFTGGYIDFENAAFYRDTRHFNVAQWWVAATVLGGFPAIVSLGFSIILLWMLRPLWKKLPDSEKPSETGGQTSWGHATAANVQGGPGDTRAISNLVNTVGAIVEQILLTNWRSPREERFVHKIDMCWLG
ncbi:hypothetical protein B0T18DRAFT_458127 [Schizothecium vesticola]|uniref:Uncharacterized protein n=1 Tax=Schizothecium vesticola TaxID=314040 RepID=A0AA40F698_9PEZI|nr:hypothetical protein B0T18DRAFT_458127 [Schizothecium vesticola]